MAQQDAQNSKSENAAAAAAAGSVVSMMRILLVDASKANDAVLFYKAAFGAEEVPRDWSPYPSFIDEDEPLIVSAELKIPGISFLVAYRAADSPTSPPVKLGQNGLIFALTTDDVDGLIAKAVGAGAVAEGETTERVEYCDDGACGRVRVANVMDPYGFVWEIRSPGLVGRLLGMKFDGPCVSKIKCV